MIFFSIVSVDEFELKENINITAPKDLLIRSGECRKEMKKGKKKILLLKVGIELTTTGS